VILSLSHEYLLGFLLICDPGFLPCSLQRQTRFASPVVIVGGALLNAVLEPTGGQVQFSIRYYVCAGFRRFDVKDCVSHIPGLSPSPLGLVAFVEALIFYCNSCCAALVYAWRKGLGIV